MIVCGHVRLAMEHRKEALDDKYVDREKYGGRKGHTCKSIQSMLLKENEKFRDTGDT